MLSRSVLRWGHIVIGLLLALYLYSPLHSDPLATNAARFLLVPLLMISGVAMWQMVGLGGEAALGVDAGSAAAVRAAGMLATRIGDTPILLVALDDGIFAIENRCPHAASPLAGGRVKDGRIACPLHGARFDVRSGEAAGSALAAVKTFKVTEKEGRVLVATDR